MEVTVPAKSHGIKSPATCPLLGLTRLQGKANANLWGNNVIHSPNTELCGLIEIFCLYPHFGAIVAEFPAKYIAARQLGGVKGHVSGDGAKLAEGQSMPLAPEGAALAAAIIHALISLIGDGGEGEMIV
jgi:hypothetical protein